MSQMRSEFEKKLTMLLVWVDAEPVRTYATWFQGSQQSICGTYAASSVNQID
jgi:hypothetical protein